MIIIDKFLQYLNQKDKTLEELQPSEAYESFKKTMNITQNDFNDLTSYKITGIEHSIERQIKLGSFKFKTEIDAKDKTAKFISKCIYRYFKSKGYAVYRYKFKKQYHIIIKWDMWK